MDTKDRTDLPVISLSAEEDRPIEDVNLRSLLRLILGGSEIAIEEFADRLNKWENDINKQQKKSEIESLRLDTSTYSGDPNESADNNSDLIRYAMIGLLFDTQDRLRKGATKLGALEKAIYRVANPIVSPVISSKVFSPFQRRFNRLVSRGQEEIKRWVDIGFQEEQISKRLAAIAFKDTVDSTINSLAENPEVQELIQTQTTGLASEVLEEARERTVSADYYFEAIARTLFRKIPRYKLPSPPPEVIKHASSLRSTFTKIKRQ